MKQNEKYKHKNMILEDIGYYSELDELKETKNLKSLDIGRVISEHKERYVVKTADKEFDAEIIGNLRFSARNRAEFPAVGDWVAISVYDIDKALIHAIYPRKTIIERQAVGQQGEKQIIATNVDSAFIIQAVDRDFNLNRIERYLTICNKSRIKPIIILNKIDLISGSELEAIISRVKKRIEKVPIIAISNATKKGIEVLKEQMIKGKTYCMLGSSGVGKSTLLNNLSGKQIMKTNDISVSTHKGRHVTSHRELIVLDHGGILIDNPGMREVGIADSAEGLETTFDMIARLSRECRYKDCKHINEVGCAVIVAIGTGELDGELYENYIKMEKEKDFFESTVAERKKKDKSFGKMLKNFKKGKPS